MEVRYPYRPAPRPGHRARHTQGCPLLVKLEVVVGTYMRVPTHVCAHAYMCEHVHACMCLGVCVWRRTVF